MESFTKCENERMALVLLKEKEKGENGDTINSYFIF